MKAFEDVLNTFSETFCTTTTEYDRMLIMFKAGMLRAAEIAEAGFQSAMADKRHVYNYNAGRCDAANAIRKEAGDER